MLSAKMKQDSPFYAHSGSKSPTFSIDLIHKVYSAPEIVLDIDTMSSFIMSSTLVEGVVCVELQTIRQVSRAFNISARMLRYYEQIGLIKTQRNADNAYRFYDEAAIKRVQQIMPVVPEIMQENIRYSRIERPQSIVRLAISMGTTSTPSTSRRTRAGSTWRLST